MPRLIDRTRIETDWTCPRRRYWATEFGGRGIVPLQDAIELRYGIAIHNALASLALGLNDPQTIEGVLRGELTELTANLPEPKKTELYNLGLGHFWGFLRAIWPLLVRDYRILHIEREMTLPIDPDGKFQMMLKPDLALERLSDSTVWYPDFKTTGYKTKKWVDGWNYALQLHAGCLALEHDLGRPVEGAFIIGLYKGYKSERDGTLRSPFTYLYHLPAFTRDGGEQVVPEKWTHEYAKGYELLPVSAYPAGNRAWVEQLPLDVLLEHFPLTGPVPLRRRQMDDFLEAQAYREQEIERFRRGELTLNQAFPQHTKSCVPVIGEPCPYIEACFSPTVGEDPVATGRFVWRTPHHQLEAAEVEDSGEGE